MNTVIAYLGDDPSPTKKAEFERCARRLRLERRAPTMRAVTTGAELVRLGEDQLPRSVDHLIVIAHGGPDWLLNSRRGVHATRERPAAGLVSAARLAEAWCSPLRPGGLVSLCACLCSRPPAWWLRQAGGYTGNDWGASAYRDLPDGDASFSATLRDQLALRGCGVRVRGHGTVGHVLYNPILREHPPEAGAGGRALFGLVLDGCEPTAARRSRWVELVRGRLAEAWLLGDDDAIRVIREGWAAV